MHTASPLSAVRLLCPSWVSPLLPGPLSDRCSFTTLWVPPTSASTAQSHTRTFSPYRFSHWRMLSSVQSLRQATVPGASAPCPPVLSNLSQVILRSSRSSPAATVLSGSLYSLPWTSLQLAACLNPQPIQSLGPLQPKGVSNIQI